MQEQSEQKRQTYIYETASYAPLARIDTEHEVDQLYYYHTDQIGTPLELTNEQGAIVWQANYKAWGEVDSFTVNEIEQNLRYQGQYFNEETELHYNTFRYYDPQVGRFTTQDPIGLLGGVNLYEYAPNSISWIDQLGLCSQPKYNPQKKFNYSQGGRMSVRRHILTRHRQSTTYTNVSKFGTDSVKKIDRLIDEGLKIGTQNADGSITAVFTKPIGFRETGNVTKTLQIFFDDKGWVRTAFPL